MSSKVNFVFELMIFMNNNQFVKSTGIRAFDEKSMRASLKLIQTGAFGRVSKRRFLWREITPAHEDTNQFRVHHAYYGFNDRYKPLDWDQVVLSAKGLSLGEDDHSGYLRPWLGTYEMAFSPLFVKYVG